MATPVSWSYGPWQTTTPYQTVQNAAPASTASPFDNVMSQDPGGGRGGRSIEATAQYGPMTGRELGGMWGSALANRALGMGVNTALTGAVPNVSPMSVMGFAPRAAMTVASMLSSLFGGVRGTDDEFGLPTERDLRDIADYAGYMASDDARAAAEAARASRASARAELSGVNAPGWAGTTGQTGVSGAGIDPGNPEAGAYAGFGMGAPGGYDTDVTSGGFVGGEGGSPGTGGRSESDPGGSGMGGDSHGFAKGGVSRVSKPTRSLYGEKGRETAVFVPENMKRPGVQGREREVEAAMKTLLRALRG